ncbi:MAG: insulinase family protein, partial [Crocinitomicaceae bacterium]|nr:insulinase family protein [Crocinitomicaceae bacterium]
MKNYILTLALILPTVLFGQIDRSIRPEAAPAPTININNSEVFVTDNGITVILSENHKMPKVSFNLVMGATPKVEGNKAGLSELAGSLIMSGTTNRSKDELDNAVDYIGARLRASHNNISMSSLTKHMETGLGLMSDVLMNANFPQSEVDRIISMNESNLLATKSDEGSMSRNAKAVANFPSTHPYGEVMTQATLDNIDRASIVQYFTETFTPSGSYLVVVGDITREQTEAAVKKNFGFWTGGDVYKTELVSANNVKGNRVIFINKAGADQSVISITYPIYITPGHEDYLKLKVLDGILGGGVFGNRLMQNLREDKAYTYGCRSRASVNNYGSTFSAGGNFKNEVTDSSIVEILMELERITEGYVEDDELNMTKSSMAGSFARSLERPSTVARFALSIIRNKLPKDYYQTYLKQLESVTKEDILMVAQKYITGSNCNIVVVGNEEVIDKITKFDSDGKVEKLDAFGNVVLDRMASDITAEELFKKYASAIAMGASGKELKKKMKAIKTYKTEMSMNI